METRESTLELLLVEDNPSDLELALHALRKHRLANHIKVARDGVEALEYLFGSSTLPQQHVHERPKVVLLDLKLPLINGLEVLARIKADPRTQNIPVVVLTSSREDPDIAECYRLGANSYIVKPVDFEQFSESIRLLGLYWVVTNQPPPE
ncbi:MAG: response regulator receiver protein [Chloroflexi bacterium]|nr:response regulator receiver protein [Chloroflexota bacterium]